MKNSHIAILAVLLLLLVNFAAAGYTERLRVQVWDQQYRAVENAQAYVKYELNSVAGTTTTKPKPTNASGFVDLLFTDYEAIEGEVDYSYILYVQYGAQTKTAGLVSVNNSNTTRLYQVQVEAYYALVRVHDQKGAAVAANVTANGQTEGTDANGNAVFQLPPGTYNLRVEKQGFVKNSDLVVNSGTGDKSVDVLLGSYVLDVSVKDENGTPIALAQVGMDGKEIATGTDGLAHFENVTDPAQTVTARYLQYSKSFSADLSKESKASLVFDISAPLIKAFHVTTSKSGAGTLSLFVDDAGISASGIDSVIVKYTVNGAENNLPTYSTGYNTFEAKVPSQPPNTLVEYDVMIIDNEGNVATQSGSYLVPATTTVEPGQTPGTGIEILPANVPPEMLLGGVVILIIVIIGAAYLLKGRKSEDGPFQPQGPPSIPSQPPEMPPSPP